MIRKLILFLILTFPLSAFGQCPSSIDVAVESNGDLRVSYCANPNDFDGPRNSDSPTLRVKPEVGPPGQIRFDNFTTGNFAFVTENSSTSSNVLRKKNNFDTDVEYTDDIDHEIPNGQFEFKLCIFSGQGANADIVACSNTIISRPPTPTIEATPDIFTEFAPSPIEDNTKVYDTKITVEYSNFQPEDKVRFKIFESLPDGWIIEANPVNTAWQDASSFITFNPNPNGEGEDGTFMIEYRVTVPLFEVPHTQVFTANYEVQ